jgi:hypothetical protein
MVKRMTKDTKSLEMYRSEQENILCKLVTSRKKIERPNYYYYICLATKIVAPNPMANPQSRVTPSFFA